jgi:tRNA(fMet)-specific endonuclease VapC
MDMLDSNILLYYVRQNPLAEDIEARYALTSVNPVPIISIVSEGELRALALQLAWGAQKRRHLEDLLDYFTIIPLPFSRVITVYAEIDDYSRRNGVAMGKNDIWIAATASVTGARLLTTDKDFDHLNGTFLSRDWIDPVL